MSAGIISPTSVCHSLQQVAAFIVNLLFIQLRGQGVMTHYSGLSSHDPTVTSHSEMLCRLSIFALISCHSYQQGETLQSEVMRKCFLFVALCHSVLNGCKYYFDTRKERPSGLVVELTLHSLLIFQRQTDLSLIIACERHSSKKYSPLGKYSWAIRFVWEILGGGTSDLFCCDWRDDGNNLFTRSTQNVRFMNVRNEGSNYSEPPESSSWN